MREQHFYMKAPIVWDVLWRIVAKNTIKIEDNLALAPHGTNIKSRQWKD